MTSQFLKFRPGQLSGKFAAAVILFSSLIALFITVGELAYEYTRDLRQIDGRMAQIQDAYIDSITENVWVFDKERIDTLLQGITRLPDFVLAELRINGKTEMRRGQGLKGDGVTNTFTLRRMHQGQQQVIGELVVAATYDGAYQRVIQRALLFLVANGIKTLLVALFIVAIFYRLVGRHIERISVYAHDHSSPDDAPALELTREKPRQADELSELVISINHLRSQLLSYSRKEAARAEGLEEQVARRTAEIVAKQKTLLIANEAAEWASRAKSNFLASMSHELRTPLNAILGFAHLLETSVQSQEDRESVQYISEAGQQLLALVENVLQLTAHEVRQIHYDIELVAVESVLLECAGQCRLLIEKQGMRFELDLDVSAAGCQVRANRERLQQALLNYVSNAIKYGKKGGMIRLGMARHDGDIRISVADDGKGISVQRQKELFTPFNRLGREGSNILGAGLGLSVTREVVELMGGHVGVQSEEGQGATFWIDLPLVQPTHGRGLSPAA